MSNQLLSSGNAQETPLGRRTAAEVQARPDRLGRLIHITLAIYLLPVLLVVMVISSVGMMFLGVSESSDRLSKQSKQTTPRNQKAKT
jgi:hypothetical protein